MGSQRLLLLDTASLYFRAFFGVPDSFRAPDGSPVNAVRGLLDFIARLVETYQPTHLACCWDNDWRPAWRVELIPSYKAHRVAGAGDATVDEMASSTSTAGEQAPDDLAVQVPVIIDVLHALGLAIVGHDGYEADDVIGTLAATAAMPVDVVTGDRDLFQVVDDAREVRVLYIARGVGKHEQVDDAWVRAKYDIPARALRRLRGAARRRLRRPAGGGRHRGEDRRVLDQLLRRAGRDPGRGEQPRHHDQRRRTVQAGQGDRLPRGGADGRGRGHAISTSASLPTTSACPRHRPIRRRSPP